MTTLFTTIALSSTLLAAASAQAVSLDVALAKQQTITISPVTVDGAYFAETDYLALCSLMGYTRVVEEKAKVITTGTINTVYISRYKDVGKVNPGIQGIDCSLGLESSTDCKVLDSLTCAK